MLFFVVIARLFAVSIFIYFISFNSKNDQVRHRYLPGQYSGATWWFRKIPDIRFQSSMCRGNSTFCRSRGLCFHCYGRGLQVNTYFTVINWLSLCLIGSCTFALLQDIKIRLITRMTNIKQFLIIPKIIKLLY